MCLDAVDEKSAALKKEFEDIIEKAPKQEKSPPQEVKTVKLRGLTRHIVVTDSEPGMPYMLSRYSLDSAVFFFSRGGKFMGN